MTEFLPHDNKKDKHPLGTLLEIARLKEIIKSGSIDWDLTKA